MVVINRSSKIIGIKETSILPGEAGEVPAGYENNPIIRKYIADGTLSMVSEVKEPEVNTLGDGGPDPDNDVEPDDGQKPDNKKSGKTRSQQKDA